MKQKTFLFSITILIASILLSACGSVPGITSLLSGAASGGLAAQIDNKTINQQPQATQTTLGSPAVVPAGGTTTLSSYETALEEIYTQVNPSVVSIKVVSKQTASQLPSGNNPYNIPGFPNFFGSPNQNNNQNVQPQYSQALGSGIVWNSDGYIVTNNHVISGADTIEVQFYDGTILSAKLVGADPNSDLAVVKVDNSGLKLSPIAITDSTQVKVGQVAVAIGNPFGLENSMTVGIVSALGRELPANEGTSTNSSGATYTIPDIIQTDAPINPGNSGGPLVNDQGALIGVTSAIESTSNSNSGIGFAIPASIVQKVIPELIKSGKYEHPYLGISGTALTPSLAQAMKLNATQRGALVEEIVPNGPADKAGLKGSASQVTIDGQNIMVGGDIITAIEGSPVNSITDLIAYLEEHTSIGQKVTLTILRNNSQQKIDVTLEARPAQTIQVATQSNNSSSQSAWLGIAGQTLTPDIAKEMKLSSTQVGVLIEQVQAGSPADLAGIQGSYKPVLINGERVLVGGDIITAIEGNAISTTSDLQSFIQSAKPGQEVKVSILRDGKEITINVTLAVHP